MGSNDNFNIIVGTQLDVSGATKALEGFKKKAERTTKVKFEGLEVFKTLTTYVNDAGQSITRVTRALEDANGKLVPITDTITKASTDFSKLNATFVETSSSTTKFTNASNEAVTVVAKLNENGERIITTTKEYTNSLGATIKETQVYNRTRDQLIVKNKEYILDTEKVKEAERKEAETKKQQLIQEQKLAFARTEGIKRTKELTTVQNQLAESNKKTSQTFSDIITKVAKFYLASLPIRAVQLMITETIQTVKDFDKAFTEMAKVADSSGESLKQYTNILADLGTEVGRTKTTMTELATGFLKAGYTEEESAQLARYGALLQNTADEQLEASEATSILVSALKAFNLQANDSMRVLDDINIVSADFAVSSSDISRGLTQAGASMATYGNSLEQTIGLITAGTEIFQGKSQQVARGLNTVASRVAKNGEALAQYGVSIQDANGDLKATYDILKELKPQWDIMTNAEKVALGTTLAGVNQYKVFSAIMSNFDKAVTSTNEQLAIHGTTLKQNAIYMDNIEAKTALFKAELEKLVLGKGGLQEFVKTIIDFGTSVLKFANNDIGQLIIKGSALMIVLSNLNKIIAIISASSLVQWGKGVIETFTLLQAKTIGVGMAMNILKGEIIGLVAIIGIALYSAYKKFNQTLEEQKEKLEELKSSYEESKNKVEELEEKLKNIKDKLKEINSNEIQIVSNGEISQLERERLELEKLYAVERRRMELKQKEYEQSAKDTVYAKVQNPFKYTDKELKGQLSGYTQRIYEQTDRIQIVKDATAEMLKWQGIIDKNYNEWSRLDEKIKSGGALTLEESSRYGELNTLLIEAKDNYEKANEIGLKYRDELVSETEALSNNSKTKKDSLEATNSLDEAIANTTKETKQYLGYADEVEEDLEVKKELADKLKQEIQKLAESLSLSKTTIDKLKQSFEALDEVLTEMNSEQGLSIETYDKLMSMGSAYVNALFDESGALRDTAEAQKELYAIKIDQMALDEVENLLQIAEAYSTDKSMINEYNVALGKTVGLEWENAYARIASLDVSNSEKELLLRKVMLYKQLADQAKSNIGAINSSTKATKNQADALKDLKKQYEDAINYIKSKYDDMINALKDEKETMVESIEKQISARKEQKEVEIEAIESEINALKEEKELREQYWDDQINALKERNQQYKDSLELEGKLDALAKARATKVKVYKKGQGFVYSQDESVIGKAQSELTKYLTEKQYEDELKRLENSKKAEMENYESRIKALENFKKEREKFFDDDIKNLEKYKKSIEDNYDEQIKVYQNYKQQFQDMVDAYEDQQSKLLVQQLTGIDLENDNWMTRLDNLQNFVNEYHKLLAQVGDGSIGGGGTTGGVGNGDSDGEKTRLKGYKIYDADTLKDKSPKELGKVQTQDEQEARKVAQQIEWEYNKSGRKIKTYIVPYYASGASSVSSNQMAVVGEDPNKEIVIGSKLNNGVVMNLNKGDGVVNAKSVNTLAGLLNSIKGNEFSERSITNNNGSTISIGSINLPEVKNGSQFIEYLQNFSVDIQRKAYSRI